MDFPGVNGTSYTVASLQMSIGGDTLALRSVSPGGREIEQVPVYQVGSRIAQALITGAEKSRELGITIDPRSFTTWNQSKDAIATQRPTITAVLIEPGMPSMTIDYEECGYMGEELPELTAGEATEFNVPGKFMPTRVRIDGQLATSSATV